MNTQPHDRNAAWAVAPHRVLADEGQNQQVVTTFSTSLLVTSRLFYESRDKYAMLIITSLRKIATPMNASTDSRKLALNMMWLIWTWEQRRVEGKGEAVPRAESLSPTTRKRKLDGDLVMSSPESTKQALPTTNEYQIPPVGRLKLVRYLVEYIAQLTERFQLPSTKARDSTHAYSPAMAQLPSCARP